MTKSLKEKLAEIVDEHRLEDFNFICCKCGEQLPVLVQRDGFHCPCEVSMDVNATYDEMEERDTDKATVSVCFLCSKCSRF